MSASDPKREFAIDVVRRLKDAGFQALWAGGCVRDYLLGREPEDYDVASDARPDDVRKLFGQRRTLAVGASFGVIIVRGPRSQARAGERADVEVATFRTEGPYLDGRRPESVAFSSPEEDARRRDFTINGMFYDPLEHRVLDFVGGERDLGAGVVRAIGDPRARMSEDKLRMLRAVRFAATLAFELDAATAEAVRDMAPEILVVSAERIAQELKRMLVHANRRRAVELARGAGLLAIILPELQPLLETAGDGTAPRMLRASGAPGGHGHPPDSPWQRTLRMLELLEQPGFALAAATLFHDLPPETARAICRRLRLANDETEHVVWLLDQQRNLDDARRATPAKLKRLLAHAWSRDLVSLVRVETLAAGRDLSAVSFVEDFLRDTPPEALNPPPLVTGNDLIAAGLQPGSRFKTLLEAVRDAQLNGEIHTRDEALRVLEGLLRGA
ncbi:MAG TPA: CCA tRNA nucleotidyltransferase [Planctomycetaceae bacterium]|nr:CCA tRNA nucleotidyltransferase [Planctomycetaceae bacterium]